MWQKEVDLRKLGLSGSQCWCIRLGMSSSGVQLPFQVCYVGWVRGSEAKTGLEALVLELPLETRSCDQSL